MKVKNILVPVDGTERSLHSLDFIKEMYEKDKVKVTLINVKELVFIEGVSMSDEIKSSEKFGRAALEKAREILDGYDVNIFFTFGYAGDEIVRRADEDDVDMIIMTKSTKKGLTRIIGSCTSYVLKHSSKIIIILPE